MKLIALLCVAGILLELSIDKVDGSCLQNTPCNKCGRGARCVFGLYCTAFCITATIAYEERYRKYCPRIGQNNPFGHLFSKRSASHSKRSTDTDVEISYKEPFLEMMDDVREQIINGRMNNGWNVTALTSMFTEIADDVETDAENCDTTTNELASIANLARNSAAAAAFLESGRLSKHARNFVLSNAGLLFEKFTSLDDSNIECKVEESSPLATYGHGHRYGYDTGLPCSGCPPHRPYCIGRCAFGRCSGRCFRYPSG